MRLLVLTNIRAKLQHIITLPKNSRIVVGANMTSFSYSRRRSYNDSGDSSDTTGQEFLTPSQSSQSAFNEQRILAKNGARVLSSMSDLLIVLAKSGIPGPKDLKVINLSERGMQIGSGSQFTVFKNRPSAPGFRGDGYFGLDGLVVKRIKVSDFREQGKALVDGRNYRRNLMSVELEIMALCQPGIRRHRNISTLIAWGRDYIDPQTPLPVLFFEVASCSLDEFLNKDTSWVIRHQVALDIAAGLEVLHKYRIVHGDLKPENVLVFPQQNFKVPFVAKLSDFGLCIDLFNSNYTININDYLGTRDWNAPELIKKDQFEHSTGTLFTPSIMLKFDAFSYGERSELPSSLAIKVCSAVRGLLDILPVRRPLPGPDLLKTDDLLSYRNWMISFSVPSNTLRFGDTDPEFNKGLAFWTRLDSEILNDAVSTVIHGIKQKGPSAQPETLFGLATGLSKHMSLPYVEKTIDLVEKAAQLGYVPAQNICARILRAHQKTLPSHSILMSWERNSLADGCYSKPRPTYFSDEEAGIANDAFRQKGGYCKEGFTAISSVLNILSNSELLLAILSKQQLHNAIDLEGNTLTHAAAALGKTAALEIILHQFPQQALKCNENGETMLYKACQAGQISVVRLLRERDHDPQNMKTSREEITPLHWLFAFQDSDVEEACVYLVGQNQGNVDSRMTPRENSSSTYHHNHFPIPHYPFELPYGTALHWATANRNFAAMEALLKNGADIDAQCYNKHPHSTPLSLAVFVGDVEVASFLIAHGANPHVVDSRNRTLLHRLAYHLPELHGSCPHSWNYWIRHGCWEDHKLQMSKMVDLLLSCGLDLETLSTAYPPLTALLTAVASGVSNGGAVFALIKAGADVNNAKGTCKDSALISWSSVASERLFYPVGYDEVMEVIVENTKDVGYANDQRQTALHVIAAIDTSQAQFESNVSALMSHAVPPDIDSNDWNGDTPLLVSLLGGSDAMFRAMVLRDRGADVCALNDRKENILGVITGNKIFMDEDSVANIKLILLQMNDSAEVAFKAFENSSNSAIWYASMYARPRTLQYLLDLGLSAHINDIQNRNGQKTALDLALDYGEASRQAYMRNHAKAGSPSPESEQFDDSYKLYDDKQGGSERAREAYWAFPATIKILKDHGAKRAWELGPQYSCENIEQPGDFDLNNIYSNGYTVETQPHRKHWSILYDLAKYSPSWMRDHIDALLPWYDDGTFRPLLVVLCNWPELCDELEKKNDESWIKAISAEDTLIEVKIKARTVIQSRCMGDDPE